MTDTTPVPSREAVDAVREDLSLWQKVTFLSRAAAIRDAKDMLGALLAEVERLTDRNEILDLQLTAAVQEYRKARVTVYEQGAALAELRAELKLRTERLAALASAQSREQEKAT